MDPKQKQKALALLAAKDAMKLLPLFEKKYPKDKRPREAIEAARDWAKGKIRVGAARNAALAAHAAARKARDDGNDAACFVARATGHAAATAHVASHSKGVKW